jgi:hypothetical protein
MTDARATQTTVLAATEGPADARATQTPVYALTEGPADARSTHVAILLLADARTVIQPVYGPIRFTAVSPPLDAEGRQLFMDMLQIDFQHGAGLNTGDGNDPQAMLRWSDDGGASWSNEHWRAIGKIGERGRRAIWRRLGRFYSRVFRLVCIGPARPVVLDAYADLDGEQG